MATLRLLTATALVWLAMPAARAGADLLPSRPITFGDGRVVVSGDVALSFGSADVGYFNLFDYSHDAFNVLTMSISADIRATDRIGFVGQVVDEVSLREREPGPSDRHVVYPYALYVRVKPAVDQPFTILAGRIPPVFGAFARRDYGEVNPLIGLPLAYGYSTTMRPEPPPSQRELLLNRGGGWAVRYPRATAAVGPQGLPLVAARRWDTGVSAQWDGGTVDAGVAVTIGTLSSPQFDDDNGGKQISGRVGFTPTASFSVGVSAAGGEYLADAGGSTDYGDVGGLPPPASYETHRQQALGLDAEYSLGHVVVRGEVVASRWDVPFQNGDPTLELDALGTSLETRVALTPRWSMAVRGDRLGFSRMSGERRRPHLGRQRPPRRRRGRLPGAAQRPAQGRLSVQLAGRRARAVDRPGRRAAPLLVLMTTRVSVRPSFIAIALALAVASLGLVRAAAPRTVATGTIRGTVTLPASAAGRRPSVSRPGGTSAADREQDALDRQTSVVYLDNMPRGMAGEFVERKARLDQRGQRFVPHVVAIGVGGTVDFPNSDPFFHNVFSLSDVRSFDLGRYASGKSKTVRFDKPGVVRVFCDIHAHMSAFVFVFAHPYFDVTDGVGRYRIDGVPPGTHTLVLWNETIEPEARQVTVPDGGEVEVNFSVAAPPAPK